MNKIKTFFKNLWNNEDGLGTLEILLIVAVLVAVALLFGETLIEWVQDILDNIDPTAPTIGG